MKKAILVLSLLSFAIPALAATVGGPELTVPEESLFLRDEAVNRSLDRYETEMDIRISLEIEIINKRKLTSAVDSTNMELEGQSYMVKFSGSFYDVFEPYVKIGSSNLEVRWIQHGSDIKVDTNPGLVWTMGAKAKLYKSPTYGVTLTLDAQYSDIDLDVDSVKIGGSTQTADAINKEFNIKELQLSLLASKKFAALMGKNDYYFVPYGGVIWNSSEIDIHFTQNTTLALYSTYDASNDEAFGLVFGCDIMPFYLSHYLLNVELRLISENAFTLGGTVKF